MDQQFIRESVMRDMSEGVIAIGFDGKIGYVNPSAERILGKNATDILGRTFHDCFLDDEENDDFTQAVLDAVYDKERVHNKIVLFHTNGTVRQLHMVTSFLRDGAKTVGLVIVLDDITELSALKIEYARQVTVLLDSLVGALSQAIDERSPYNANHTRNMVRYAERFLDWLETADAGWHFDEESRRAFLMSVWLHDVGKLAVPLSVMDKATRLGPALDGVRMRLREMTLLDRVARAEGRLSETAYDARESERQDALRFIERINAAPFLPDEELAFVDELSRRTYTDMDGVERPWLTAAELTSLRIRKGTLTDAEREIMQSHVVVTEHILDQVTFPRMYASVPYWAAAHHEQLGGGGYPRRIKADAIPREVRLLTILDVFEALTAKDRPYKAPTPPEKALVILHDMVREGILDGDILSLFEASRAWEDA